MANQVAPRHFLIDTASGTAVWLSNLDVRSITWTGATAGGHQARVKNAAGTRIIFDALSSEVNDFESAVYDCGWVEGLMIDVLASGKLLIVCG